MSVSQLDYINIISEIQVNQILYLIKRIVKNRAIDNINTRWRYCLNVVLDSILLLFIITGTKSLFIDIISFVTGIWLVDRFIISLL